MERDYLLEALAATAELCGTTLSKPAAQWLLNDLEQYDTQAVLKALARCRRELKGKLTLAEIVSRIDDGRPGADEAWGMLVWDEESTAVLTSEMEEAQGAAWSLWKSGDRTGARMAFKDRYTRLLTEAREQRQPIQWRVSLGWDKAARVGPLLQAVEAKRISPSAAQRFLPEHTLTPDGKLLESGMSERVQKMIRGVITKAG